MAIQRTKDSRPWLIYELGPSQDHRPEHDLGGESEAPSAEDLARGIEPEWGVQPRRVAAALLSSAACF